MPDPSPAGTDPDSGRRRPGRPSRPALTTERIAREALAIIDELGWSACTMTKLASRLGVRAPSLYHHIDGQRDLADLIRGVIVPEIHDPAILDMSWEDAFEHFGVKYYRAFAQHPNCIQALSMAPVRDEVTIEMYETFLRALVRHDWPADIAFEALLGIEYLALGFAYEWNAADLMLDPEYNAEHGAPILAEVTRGRIDQPTTAEVAYFALLHRQIEMFRSHLAAA